MASPEPSTSPRRRSAPPGFTAIGLFLVFGTTMALLAGMSLVLPGTPLDRTWALNPRAYHELAPLGRRVGIPFLLLSAALAAASIGWFHRRRWGWRTAVVIIATQVSGDVVNIFSGRMIEGIVGSIIAGALLVYLSRRPVRESFGE